MRFAVERSRTAISGRGLLRAFGRLWVVLLVACGLYVGFARAGVVHSPFFVITEGGIEDAQSDEPGLRVLFVGNSFTFYNDMPRMVQELAAEDSGAPPVFSVSRTRGSWTFEGATDDEGLDSLLEDVDWDFVILQERSWMLSFDEDYWLHASYPYADELRRKIEAAGSEGILFETWGYRNGFDDGDTYEWMQGRLLDGGVELAEKLGMDMAPVGNAWYAVHGERPELDLWDSDGRHPNPAGSYLAACVFYAQLTGRDPTQSRFMAGLDPDDARYLQKTAAHAVAYWRYQGSEYDW
jgi:hypothetical protein